MEANLHSSSRPANPFSNNSLIASYSRRRSRGRLNTRNRRIVVASDDEADIPPLRARLNHHEDDTQHSTPDSVPITLSSDNESDDDQQFTSNTRTNTLRSRASGRRRSQRTRAIHSNHFVPTRAQRNALNSSNDDSSISEVFAQLRNNFERRNRPAPPSTSESHSSAYFRNNVPSATTNLTPTSEQTSPLVTSSGNTRVENDRVLIGLNNLPTLTSSLTPHRDSSADSDTQLSAVQPEPPAAASITDYSSSVGELPAAPASDTIAPPASSSTTTSPVSNNKASASESSSGAATAPQARADLNASTLAADNSCMICMEPWTNGGLHRLVTLRCGHLFGRACIEAWLDSSGTRATSGGLKATCPNCKKLFARKDITVIFPRGSLLVLDTTELEAVRYETPSCTHIRKG